MTRSNEELPPQLQTPFLRVQDMISGLFVSQALNVAAQLGIADLLKDGPKTIDELARTTGSDARALYRVLRMLASRGVFAEEGEGRFVTTPMGQTLESGALGSLREMSMLMCVDDYWNAVGKCANTVKTGGSGFQEIWGKPFYAHLAEHPEKARIFWRGMSGVSDPNAAAIAATYDFSGVQRLIDVGGGNGTYLHHILAANPALRGTLFDRPHVVETARGLAEGSAVKDRIDFVPGDFFESVPSGGDAYILENILHNWSDERSIAILKNVRRAMSPGARLLIVEPVISPKAAPTVSETLDMIMLVVFGGGCGQRTEAEFARLFEAAGFRMTRILPTDSMVALVEGEPV